jgi:CubicO group peptidase (beta-lactamase class C family)/D-alanyl-D-alanine dipeptidase
MRTGLTAALTAATLTLALSPVPGRGDTPPPAKYAAAVRALERFIEGQVADKELPALSIALVDDQRIVWARGFGFARPKDRFPATAGTVYRVGSVSELFTDVGILRLVEQGRLDLDAPVTSYLPDFRPANPFAKPVTLRQLMTHRSGLVREPPVGSSFDPTEPGLARTVESLNRTELLFPPGERTNYSNAAVAVAGYVLEATQHEPFAKYLRREVLEPLGMARSAFEVTPALRTDLAVGTMWTYQGREFEAPTFALGIAPAGGMYSTVEDLARFLTVRFAGGRGPKGSGLKPATLEQLWTPQPAKAEDESGFGPGFTSAELDGRRCVGHAGGVYGFTTELAALPDEKLGVVVAASRDGVNAVTTRIADVALRHLLAVRDGKPLPKIEETGRLPDQGGRVLVGRYRRGDRVVEVQWRPGQRPRLFPAPGGVRADLAVLGTTPDKGLRFITDDRLHHGLPVVFHDNQVTLGKDVYERQPDRQPEPASDRWAGLIGEYGWDHSTLYILERDGKLHALLGWFYLIPLEEESESVFKFSPGSGLDGEKLVFRRDARGRATEAQALGVGFRRRHIDGEDGSTFRIRPVRPVDALRREALAARPPEEQGEFRPSDLVDVLALDASIRLDVRYATTNNFLSTPMYTSARAYLQRPATEALVRVHRRLAERGYGLLIHDAYRPWYVTKMFWEATPEAQHVFVADPSKGSRHNRGCAVDLTLYDRRTGRPVPMVGGYDEMSDRSYPDYPGGTSRQRWHRDLLRRAMEAEGFTVYDAEWWHFDYRDWQKYRIGNLTFEEIAAGKRGP